MPSRMEEQMKLREARVSYLRQTSLPNKGGALLQIRSDLRQVVAVVVAVLLTLAPLAWAERTQLKPGWNLFSPEQDAQLGRQVSRDAERQVPMLNDARVDAYLNSLGRRLAAHAPYHYFQYQFKCVNDRAINAFALPGGIVYINRGVLEAADNEAQVAGVMAHEISHVELRHGTNQATKAYAWQVPLGVLGGALGNNAVGAVAQAIGGFAVNSVLLKYSRTAESQADILGTQILYDSGYDPRAMAQFFEKIEAESKGGNPAEFFSTIPARSTAWSASTTKWRNSAVHRAAIRPIPRSSVRSSDTCSLSLRRPKAAGCRSRRVGGATAGPTSLRAACRATRMRRCG